MKARCPVARCKRSHRSVAFCDHHWRMVPERMKRAIIVREVQAIQIARVHVEIAEREDARSEKAGL